MNEPKSFTREEINTQFEALDKLLKANPPEAQGAQADEFMLMHRTDDPHGHGTVVGFKHSDTRNYLFVLHPTGTDKTPSLHVPKTEKMFMRGEFKADWTGR